MAQQAPFIRAFRHAKRENKLRLANWIEQHMGLVVETDAMFDVQVKRIHEYRRQLLNVLHVIARYRRIVAAHDAGAPASARCVRMNTKLVCSCPQSTARTLSTLVGTRTPWMSNTSSSPTFRSTLSASPSDTDTSDSFTAASAVHHAPATI